MKALLISLLSLAFGAWYFLPVTQHESIYSEFASFCSSQGDVGGTCSISCPKDCAGCNCTGHTFGCSCECIGCTGGNSQASIDVNIAPEEELEKVRSILMHDGSAVALQIIEQLNELERLDPATSPEVIREKLILLDKLVAQLHSSTANELKDAMNIR